MMAILYDLVFQLPVALIVMLSANPYLSLELSFRLSLVIAMAVIAMGLLFKHLGAKVRIALAGLWGAAFVVGGYLRMHFRESEGIPVFDRILIQALLMTACFLVTELMQRYRWLRLLAVLAGLVTLGALAMYEVTVEKWIVLLTYLFALFTITDLAGRYKKTTGERHPEGHLVLCAPFWLAAMLVIAFVKIPEKPYDWKIVKTMLSNADRLMSHISEKIGGTNSWDSDGAHIGFSTGGGFYNTLSNKGYPALELTPSWNSDPIVLLSGKSFDTFNGREWIKSPYTEEKEREFDAIETLSWAMDVAGDQPLNDLLKRNTIWVRPLNIKTNCLFMPSKTIPLRAPERADKLGVAYEGGDAFFQTKNKDRVKYSVGYYRLNRNDATVEKLKGPVRQVTKASWDAAIEESRSYAHAPGKEAPPAPSFEDYAAYHERIRKRFCPKTELSPKLQEYCDELLAGSQSDYETCERIETMLREMAYTTEPGALPDEVQDPSGFLEYMLFQEKKGYCSHFATAFILLARANNIPARYVQGFRTSVYMRTQTEVLSTDAHAWPEAYLEGIGWVTFEPTPIYKKKVVWKTEEEKEEELALAEGVGKESLGEDMTDSKEPGEVVAEGEMEQIPEPETQIGMQLLNKDFWKEHSRLILFFVLAAFSVALCIVATDALIKRIRYQRMSQKEKGLWLCKRQLAFLAHKKAGKKEYETLQEYVGRMQTTDHAKAVAFCGIYEQLLYTEFEPSDAQLSELWESFGALKKQYRKFPFQREKKQVMS